MEEGLNTGKKTPGTTASGLTYGMPEEEIFMANPLTLAYIGDAVFELMAREYMLATGSHQPDKLHKHTVAKVNAAAQSAMAAGMLGDLTKKELAVYKRGRNATTATWAKHQTMGDYRKATGLEAVFGYLYLSGNRERLYEVFKRCMEEETQDDGGPL